MIFHWIALLLLLHKISYFFSVSQKKKKSYMGRLCPKVQNPLCSYVPLLTKKVPYLPLYNACPCIIRTLIFDHFFILKKDLKTNHQELKLQFFHFKSWEFIICLQQFLTSCYYKHRAHRAPIYKLFYSIKVKCCTNVVT